ncbi:hypothetical protein ACPB8Q_06600 [Methanocaldococcus indicus]|uniref:hypothetical protein n=1 Tax=Methanocaldococcus indicus TaxID=213231 RepID=UPI003C6D7425
MMPQYHLIASIILALIYYVSTSSLDGALFCFIFGFFVDVDHLIDFWIYKKKIIFSKEIFEHFYEKFGKVIVLFHSLEFVFLLILFGFLFPNLSKCLFGASIGLLSHLILDFSSYELHPLSYFLVYRIFVKFDKKYVCAK